MRIPYELVLGWRYTRAGRATRRNGFISFISGVSMLGIALGVAALIIVLSVMNGFQKEVRDRMLSVISHVEIYQAQGEALPDWQATAAQARLNPQVVGAAQVRHSPQATDVSVSLVASHVTRSVSATSVSSTVVSTVVSVSDTSVSSPEGLPLQAIAIMAPSVRLRCTPKDLPPAN